MINDIAKSKFTNYLCTILGFVGISDHLLPMFKFHSKFWLFSFLLFCTSSSVVYPGLLGESITSQVAPSLITVGIGGIAEAGNRPLDERPLERNEVLQLFSIFFFDLIAVCGELGALEGECLWGGWIIIICWFWLDWYCCISCRCSFSEDVGEDGAVSPELQAPKSYAWAEEMSWENDILGICGVCGALLKAFCWSLAREAGSSAASGEVQPTKGVGTTDTVAVEAEVVISVCLLAAVSTRCWWWWGRGGTGGRLVHNKSGDELYNNYLQVSTKNIYNNKTNTKKYGCKKCKKKL